MEKDAALAKQERKKHEKEKNALKEEKQKVEDKNINSDLELHLLQEKLQNSLENNNNVIFCYLGY